MSRVITCEWTCEWTCDRCGNVVTTSSPLSPLHWTTVKLPMVRVATGYDSQEWELCPDCVRGLHEWATETPR